MIDSFASLGTEPITDVTLWVPHAGPWIAEVVLSTAESPSGSVQLRLGDLVLTGTVDATAAGMWGERGRCRVVGGAGGWGLVLPPKAWHNDAGVRALEVAQAAQREAGETLGNFDPGAERLGVNYVRPVAHASRSLEDAAGGAVWWVDYTGITHVGTRTVTDAVPESYAVQDYDPKSRLARLSVDPLSAVGAGTRIQVAEGEAVVVRDLTISIAHDSIEVLAWCGGSAAGRGRLAGLLADAVGRLTDEKLTGIYRYRVTRMIGDRVELQAASTASGVPDLLLISMAPGVAGAHASLAPGSTAYVQFADGDRTQPLVTHFAGKDDQGHVPASLSLCGGGQRIGRQGDLVQSGGVGTMATFSPLTGPNPVPMYCGTPYLISFDGVPPVPPPTGPAAPLYGAISTGSQKADCG